MLSNIRNHRVIVGDGATSFDKPYTLTPSDASLYKLSAGPQSELFAWKRRMILEEQEGHQWSLMSRCKYPPDLKAAAAVACEVESAMEETRVDSQRQLIRCVFVFSLVLFNFVVQAKGRPSTRRSNLGIVWSQTPATSK